MAYGLTSKLEHKDGTLADPPTFRSAAPGVSWERATRFPPAGMEHSASSTRGSMRARRATPFRCSWSNRPSD
jgi:hypothetical protein